MTELITNSPSKQQQIQDDRLYRHRAKRLRFLINGDKYFQGIHYALNTEKIRSFDSLLNDLTSILSLDHLKLCKGVRVIFDLHGNAISNLATFQDGQSYLCSSIESFVPTDYRLNNNGMLNWLVRNSTCISQSGHHNSRNAGNKHKTQTNNATPNPKDITRNNNELNQNNGVSSNNTTLTSRYSRGLSSARNSSSTPTATASHNNKVNSGRNNRTQISDNHTSSNSDSEHLNNNQTKKNSARGRTSRVNNFNSTPRASPRTTPNLVPTSTNSISKTANKVPKKTPNTNHSTAIVEPSHDISKQKQTHDNNSNSTPKQQLIDDKSECERLANSPTEKPPGLPAHKHLGILNSPQSINRLEIKRVSSPKSRSPLIQSDENIKQDDDETSNNPSQELRTSFGPEVLIKYDIGSPIGDGHFSVVYCCMNKSSQELCALKLIDKSKCRGHDDMIYNEVKILKQLSHPNIVKLIEEFDYSDELYLILELVQDGDLFDAISAVTKFCEVHVSTMIHNLSSALTYLHRQGIVHRDIKPENLLVSIHEDGSHSLKLADFGLAVELSESQPLYSVCGTAFYVSPEMLSECGYDYKVDVWSTGVICFILLCGYPPFTSTESENNQDELFDAILAGDFKFDQAYWSKISQHAKNLIRCMLEVDPEKRYTAEQVFTHPWTAGTSSNFNGLESRNLSRQIASMPC